jgi:hypothetical protein
LPDLAALRDSLVDFFAVAPSVPAVEPLPSPEIPLSI